MTAWTWVLGGTPPLGTRRRELTKATGRTAVWRLDAAGTAQFSIDGRANEAGEIDSLATDLQLLRDGDMMQRYRIGPESDDISPGRHACQFTAADYRGMLAYRITGTDGAYYPPGTPCGEIAYDLITTSQALDGGDWGITAGIGCTTGTTRELTVLPGKPIIESIAELGRLDGGFDWEINADADGDLKLDIWHGGRGADNGVVLDYGGLLNSVNRMLDPSDFANAVLVTGTEGTTPVLEETVGIATDLRGRWEHAEGTTIELQTTLNARAPWLLDQASTLKPTVRVRFRPGRWTGKDHVWLGDTVRVAVRSGRLLSADGHRVVEVSIQPGERGTETVTMGLLPA